MGLHEIHEGLSAEEHEEKKVANEICDMLMSGDQEDEEGTVRSEWPVKQNKKCVISWKPKGESKKKEWRKK